MQKWLAAKLISVVWCILFDAFCGNSKITPCSTGFFGDLNKAVLKCLKFTAPCKENYVFRDFNISIVHQAFDYKIKCF